ncbi:MULTISPECIES: multidrug effflux MFS transporter [unclassified Bosea (in: a-proteobacteria)]|uniref:multidrug effflux MFS transporter n=1 Tax=unclassified Bosea (in: a-proteobacteria) TaxID=2653178 RepID=UPI000953A6FE|nr:MULTISPECIES: multidrug effflux MFS transporter [unclassified Bosea (in: a-proteobacteria)]SIR53787.1 MFS transporter, DHA1 family, bicyclomycin/chloramphenicol resistance protein [Bosea sp. TND4EK4]
MNDMTAIARPRHGMGFYPFVGLAAALMATNALAIDSMLPALPQMAEALGIAEANQRQWIITAYLLGFGISQIFYGTISDRYGRRPVLLAGLSVYVVASIAAAFAGSFESMMIARIVQGIGAAATRVLVVSIVRDCYSGREMARVMSLAMIVFLAVPILAPSIGQAILWIAPWRWIFGLLTSFGAAVMLFVLFRLPETQHPEDRKPINLRNVSAAFRTTLTSRVGVGYMLAMAFVLGGLFGFINSAQQIFVDVFHAPELFTTIFAGIAMFMAAASLLNSRIVGRLGMRRVSHGALVGYILLTSTHALLAVSGHESLISFALFQGGAMFCFGLIGPNFGALAMDPLGHVAGTASSVQGFVTTVVGALLGFYIGQHFDGTIVPITLGFALYGLMALVIVLLVEKGRLFNPAPGRS